MQILFRPLKDDLRLVAAEPDWELFDEMPFDLDAAKGRYAAILDDWASLHGLRTSDLAREMDTEDWTENAVRLLAAARTDLPVHLVRRGETLDDAAIGPSLGTGGTWDPEAPTIFCGSLLRQDPLFVRWPGDDRADVPDVVWPPGGFRGSGDDYWRDPVLLAALGRRAAMSSGNSGGPDGYVATTRRLVEEGAGSVMAKIVFQSKYDAPRRIELPRAASGRPDVGDDAVWRAYCEAFDANLLDCEERRECFLVQEERPMEAEYRIVVAGGRPVAGAGCVESLCPIFHDPAAGPFDPVVEGRRGDGSLSSDPDLVARYLARARELCDELAKAGTDRFEDCTMDFAVDAETDSVLLVETNPLQNFGLYAMDFGPVMEAGVEAARRMRPDGESAPRM